MKRPLIASLCLASTLLSGGMTGWAASTPAASSTPTPPTPVASLSPKTVITDINGMVATASTKWNRLVVVGQDNNARPFVAENTTYAVIDIKSHRLLSRNNTNGTIDNSIIDDQRGLAYLTVSTLPTRVSGSGSSYHVELWTIDLRNGRLLSHRLFYEGEQATMTAMRVDGPTGHVFIATTRGGSGTYELLMIDPSTMNIRIQSLEGPPDHVFVDSLHHRVVVTTIVGIQATTSNYIGFDTRTEARVWTHLFTYTASTYQNYTMVFNPRTQQIWAVAPGGLVTVVDAATGHIARQIQMTYNRPDSWTQVGFALDTQRNIGYAQWAGAACNVDTATMHTAIRKIFFDYSPSSCGGANASLIAVDEEHSHLIIADTAAIHTFDTHTGKEVRTISLLDSKGQASTWFDSVTLQDSGHVTLVFFSDVAHQNEATGALITGAAIFVPVS